MTPTPKNFSAPGSNRFFKKSLILLITIFLFSVAALLLQFGLNSAATREETPAEAIGLGVLVEDFPEFPVYPSATLINSVRRSDDESDAFEAVWQTSANIAEVSQWYGQQFDSQNWLVLSAPENIVAEEQFFQVIDEDGTNINLSLEKEEGATVITVEVPFQ